jgi:hypothetical protein
MFQIKSYLHYKNTPNGKPRVLVEGADYNLSYLEGLYLTDKQIFSGYYSEENTFVKVKGEMLEVANLSDCRPLLTVEIDGVEWTEGDIFEWQPYGSYSGNLDEVNPNFFSFYIDKATKEIKNYRDTKSGYKTKIGSFFDNPKKYSKLLWNCSEKDGWKKVFELLNI